MEPPRTFTALLKRLVIKEKMGTAIDNQTKILFDQESEAIWDIAAAAFSVLYLLAMLILFCWALFDIYHGQNHVLRRFFAEDMTYPDSPLAHLIAYTVIGGGLGGVVNGFRSIVSWHAERRAFGWRFTWKYVTLPPLGAVLAAMVYALVHGGVSLLGGSFPQDQNSANQTLSAFGIGALAGYGSQEVFKWLDAHVNRIFSIVQAEAKVPDLAGKSREQAETALKEAGLTLGKVDQKTDSDDSHVGNVIGQTPEPGSTLARGKSVDITVGAKAGPQ